MAGIAFVLALIETSFNPALYRRKINKKSVTELLFVVDRSITNPLENTTMNFPTGQPGPEVDCPWSSVYTMAAKLLSSLEGTWPFEDPLEDVLIKTINSRTLEA